ncbi:MAG: glycogen synthase [Clostridiales bacterium]|jgi:starch synthase|nr:glycogen synthase [Clostridiales bacterium]
MPEKKKAAPIEATVTPAVTAEKKSKKPATPKPAGVQMTPIRDGAGAPEKKRVLFVASEAQPFSATGGLGDVIGSLPRAVTQASPDEYDVRVIIPYYPLAVADKFKADMHYVGCVTVHLSWRSQYCGVFSLAKDGVTYYFIDNEYYFKRSTLYGYFDDGERFAFFSKAALDILPLLDFFPHILHAHDWQTALVPVYYKLYYQYQHRYGGMKTIFTIHNIEYQGKFPKTAMEDLLGIPFLEYPSLEYEGCINLMKAALDYADVVSTVSPTYAQEILSSAYAHGLAPVLHRNSHKLIGILNGIDTVAHNPEDDRGLFAAFSASDLSGKATNKRELQKLLGLPQDPDVPMLAVVSRLVAHKGIDLLKAICPAILREDVQLVVLGKGDAEFEAYFAQAGRECRKVAAVIAYNADMAHKIYAAADIFLMPSKSEPCGLAQMIASRYGALPVVRETGGLLDSIHDCGDDGGHGNGVTFRIYSPEDCYNAVRRALALYGNKEAWARLVPHVMGIDFSWDASARAYIALYDRL